MMLRVSLLAVASFAFVAACGSSPLPEAQTPPASLYETALTLHGDTRFDAMDRHLVELACEAWRKFSRGGIRIRVVWDLDELALDVPRIVRTPAYLPAVQMADAHGGGLACGWVSSSPVVVHIVTNDLRRCPELYPVILHELGHVAGLEDLRVAGAVMSGRSSAWKFTRADDAECARAGLCEAP